MHLAAAREGGCCGGLALFHPSNLPTPIGHASSKPMLMLCGHHSLGGIRVSWEPWCWSRLPREEPRFRHPRELAMPSGASRPFSSSVAMTSTSSGSIWQASARAWPVAMMKFASAAKVPRPPRTRASWISRVVAGAEHLEVFSPVLLLWGVSSCRDPGVELLLSSGMGDSTLGHWQGAGGAWPLGIALWVISPFSFSTQGLLWGPRALQGWPRAPPLIADVSVSSGNSLS